jgi:hypothetical protein
MLSASTGCCLHRQVSVAHSWPKRRLDNPLNHAERRRPAGGKLLQMTACRAVHRRACWSPTGPVTPEVAGSSPVAPASKSACTTASSVVSIDGISGLKHRRLLPDAIPVSRCFGINNLQITRFLRGKPRGVLEPAAESRSSGRLPGPAANDPWRQGVRFARLNEPWRAGLAERAGRRRLSKSTREPRRASSEPRGMAEASPGREGLPPP